MKARALVDLPGTNIRSGEFFEADDAVVKALVKSGDVDDKAQEEDVYGAKVPAAKTYPKPEATEAAEAVTAEATEATEATAADGAASKAKK